MSAKPAPRVIKQCEVCGAEIRVKASHASKEGRYCSRACMAAGYSKKLLGADNPNFQGKDCYSSEYVRQFSQRRRARMRAAPGKFTDEDVKRIYDRQRGECVTCGVSIANAFHVDHVVPISKGGTNHVGNIQLLCGSCNCRKQGSVMASFRRKAKRVGSTEDDEQAALMAMCGLHETQHPALKSLFHVPNGGHRTMNTAKKMKKLGVKPGVPDLVLAFPAGGFHGLAIELKSMTGYASREQKDWIERLRANGYRAEVCRGWEAAWTVICEYLGIRA